MYVIRKLYSRNLYMMLGESYLQNILVKIRQMWDDYRRVAPYSRRTTKPNMVMLMIIIRSILFMSYTINFPEIN
jgi:hypothetical protein